MKTNIITIGGAIRDITFLTNKGRVIETPRNLTERALLGFEYGAKIKSQEVYFNFGGGACNTAATFSKLGLKTAVCSRVGNDTDGEFITSNLKKRKISPDLIQLDKQKRTGFSLVVVNKNSEKTSLCPLLAKRGENSVAEKGERVIFVYKGANDDLKINSRKILSKKPDWFYVTSLAGEWEKSLNDIFKLTKKNKIKIAINPGADQIKGGLKKLSNILAVTEILILNRDEAIELVGSKAGNKKLSGAKLNNIKFLVSELLKAGSRVVVITDGEKGAYAGKNPSLTPPKREIKNSPLERGRGCVSQEEKTHPCPSQEGNYKVLFSPASADERVDATGAGDAFGSAFVGGYILNNGDLEKSLKFGIINSGGVVGEYGAQNGILGRREIKGRMGKLDIISLVP